MANLCIIPARGGSKRIPRKNIKSFLGEPIIAYSIRTALATKVFDTVMVSTDDEEIKQVAIKAGAEVPFLRSESNANDTATTVDVLLEVVETYKSLGKTFDAICCFYPTSPLTKVEHIREGLDILLSEDCEKVIPVVPFTYPIWRGLKKKNNTLSLCYPEHEKSRSQDLEEVYHDVGQWYWFKAEAIGKGSVFENARGVELSPLLVQDIDNEHDWALAELKYERLQSLK